MSLSLINDLTEQVLGAAFEVHSHLGPGFLESVYEEAMATELNLRNIPFERQKVIDIGYKGFSIGNGRLDLLVDKQIIVELKAVDSLNEIYTAQTLSYLKATGLQVGLLINFNVSSLICGIKRVILSKDRGRYAGCVTEESECYEIIK